MPTLCPVCGCDDTKIVFPMTQQEIDAAGVVWRHCWRCDYQWWQKADKRNTKNVVVTDDTGESD